MYECRTNYRKSEEEKKVQSQKEARDSEGVGAIWKRDSSGRKVSGPSSHSIPLEKGIGARSRYYSQREETQDNPQIKSLEKENQSLKEALAFQSQELMLLKKEMNLV